MGCETECLHYGERKEFSNLLGVFFKLIDRILDGTLPK
jgi:hypothetical protein